MYYELKNNPALRTQLESKYLGIYRYVSPTKTGRFRERSFRGTTWHHHGSVGGLLQLVYRKDHRSRHRDYHAKGYGGRSRWGGGKACK